MMDAQKALVCSVVTVATLAVLWLYRRSKKEKIPTEWTAVGKVGNLHLYPLKSGRRLEITEAECTNRGIIQITDKAVFKLQDRFLIVYNDSISESEAEFKTARELPKMVLIEVSNHDADHVAFDAPGMRTLYVQIPQLSGAKIVKCRLHGSDKTELVDCGNEAANWLSRFLLDSDSGLRLGVHNKALKSRTVQPKFRKFYPNILDDDMGLFSDLTGFMLINKASVDDMNTRLEKDVASCQFRGNIIVDEVEKPYVEDSWQWIKIGDSIFQNIKPCTRCLLTTVDAETGTKDSERQPVKILKTYRQLPNEEERKAALYSPVLGIHIGLTKPGVIKVNDIVYVGFN